MNSNNAFNNFILERFKIITIKNPITRIIESIKFKKKVKNFILDTDIFCLLENFASLALSGSVTIPLENVSEFFVKKDGFVIMIFANNVDMRLSYTKTNPTLLPFVEETITSDDLTIHRIMDHEEFLFLGIDDHGIVRTVMLRNIYNILDSVVTSLCSIR